MESLPLRGTEASIYIIPEPDFSIDPDAPGSEWPDVEPPPEFYQTFVDEEEEEELEEEEEVEEFNSDEFWTAAAVNSEAAERMARLSLRGDLYSHLPSSTVNWSLEGLWDCVHDNSRTGVCVCVCCSALNRPCTFSAISILANEWGNKPSLSQNTPLSMCSRTEWRFMTFYRSLTPAELHNAQITAAPFGGEENLINFADVQEDEQEATVSEEDLEEDLEEDE
ncbi:unnamed protein product [Clonostachys rosea f. rosea IK726]|uniref:Uncharacterized protein n=1 Tax=Clonostachys rosea f. rosea IK726 TaxID=1349383 RepID=A0ACA9TYD1_BIOOC|nr:unnamed protein product [Clonostachys rosea f. rosea IK726]